MKTIYKISHILLSIGWFAFMFLCAYGMRLDNTQRLIIFMVGLFVCFLGAVSFLSCLQHKGFWLNNKELDEEIEKTRKARDNYLNAEKCLINKILESEGMSIGKKQWLFLAYQSESDYPHTPYFYKAFYDFDKMKTFSREHSAEEKLTYPNYVSNYFQINNTQK